MIIFGIIFIYICICIAIYITQPKITAYEVLEGALENDNTYTGFIIRDETIVNAEAAGYINYYAREGEKVGMGQVVYTIDQTGDVASLLSSENSADTSSLSNEDLSSLQSKMQSFSTEYASSDFGDVYDFKYDIENTVLELVNTNLLESLSEGSSAQFQKFTSPVDGIVVYSTDGYESITTDTFSQEMLDQDSYEKTILRSADTISTDNAAYKVITSENWSVIIALDEETADKLSDKSSINVTFKKDDVLVTASLELFQKDDGYYAKLGFKNSVIRYAIDRYIDIDLELSDVEGLKIPVSSIVEKEFYTIPKEYGVLGGDSSEISFLQETYAEDGSETQTLVTPTIYYTTDEEYYVGTHVFNTGDYLIKQDSSDRYTIGKTAAIEGVYNINKGYAVFKQIDELYKNEEYCIVAEDTSYGLDVYDHIALDGKAVEEDDIVY